MRHEAARDAPRAAASCRIRRGKPRRWRFGARPRSGTVTTSRRNPGFSRGMTPGTSTFGQTRPILIGAAVMLSLGMGLRQSLGLFLTPVTHDLAVTATEFTLSVAIQNIVWGLSQAPVGAIADRFGLRVTLL